jgi:hypothetical protein
MARKPDLRSRTGRGKRGAYPLSATVFQYPCIGTDFFPSAVRYACFTGLAYADRPGDAKNLTSSRLETIPRGLFFSPVTSR